MYTVVRRGPEETPERECTSSRACNSVDMHLNMRVKSDCRPSEYYLGLMFLLLDTQTFYKTICR